MHRLVVTAARRRTWLIILDCGVSPQALGYARNAVHALPPTLTPPTILCVTAEQSTHTAFSVHAGELFLLSL